MMAAVTHLFPIVMMVAPASRQTLSTTARTRIWRRPRRDGVTPVIITGTRPNIVARPSSASTATARTTGMIEASRHSRALGVSQVNKGLVVLAVAVLLMPGIVAQAWSP